MKGKHNMPNWLKTFLRLLTGGCPHRDLSFPFTHDGQTYRSCLNCGARRSFNLVRFEQVGGFYFDRPRENHGRHI